MFFLGMSSIVLVNIMTAIIVEYSFSAARKDTEMVAKHLERKRQHQITVLYKMFKELDEDATGTLSKKEFTDVLDDPMFCLRIQSLELEISDLPDVFDICDDGDGSVSSEEFIKGMLRIQGNIMQKDVLATYQNINALNRSFKRTAKRGLEGGLVEPMDRVSEQVRNMKLRSYDIGGDSGCCYSADAGSYCRVRQRPSGRHEGKTGSPTATGKQRGTLPERDASCKVPRRRPKDHSALQEAWRSGGRSVSYSDADNVQTTHAGPLGRFRCRGGRTRGRR
jgi:hypothetical protein